jgi:hypothetical protein
MLDVTMRRSCSLDYYDIQLPKPAARRWKYAERLFSRPAFIEALTSAERDAQVTNRRAGRRGGAAMDRIRHPRESGDPVA